MSWAKVDDQIYKNEKLLACTPAARWLFIALITFSRDEDAAGNLSRGQMAFVIGSQGCKPTHLKELMAAGLVVDQEPFFVINDYEEFNPLTSKERMRKLRSKRHEGQDGDAVCDVTPASPVTSLSRAHVRAPGFPVPEPVSRNPVISPTASSHTDEAMALLQLWGSLTGRRPTVEDESTAEGFVAEFQVPTKDEFLGCIEDRFARAKTPPKRLIYFRQALRELNDSLRDRGRTPRGAGAIVRLDGFRGIGQ